MEKLILLSLKKSDEEFSFINCVSKIETNIIKTESQEFLIYQFHLM